MWFSTYWIKPLLRRIPGMTFSEQLLFLDGLVPLKTAKKCSRLCVIEIRSCRSTANVSSIVGIKCNYEIKNLPFLVESSEIHRLMINGMEREIKMKIKIKINQLSTHTNFYKTKTELFNRKWLNEVFRVEQLYSCIAKVIFWRELFYLAWFYAYANYNFCFFIEFLQFISPLKFI